MPYNSKYQQQLHILMNNTLLTTQQVQDLLTTYKTFEEQERYKESQAIENQIKDQFVSFFNDFPFDFILETLEALGYNPAILSDNDGNWTVNSEEMEITQHHFCYPFYNITWSPTIKDAVKYYIDTIIKPSLNGAGL